MFKFLYSLILIISFVFTSLMAQPFYDTFDSYTAGQMLACQNPTDWTTWSNSPCNAAEDPLISNAQSFSSPNSLLLTLNKDLVKPFGALTTGKWYIRFMVYIPTGKAGYFNTLAHFAGASSNWAMQAYLNVGGTGTIDAAGANSASFTYPYDTWFPVSVIVDLGIDQAQLYVNEVLVHTWQYTLGTFGNGSPLQLDATNFYGATANDEMYIDDYWIGNWPTVPVELTSFTANVNPLGEVVLNWVTASELNNRGFEIERKSINGSFIIVGFVEGYGTTTDEQLYSFVDKSVDPGNYIYRLKQVDFNGQFEYSNEIELDVTPPLAFNLEQNYPNPFNPNTSIKYSLSQAGFVKLAVYNTLGEEIQILANEYKEAGFFEVNFNAANLPSGTYIYKIEAPGFVEAKKMILMK